MRSHRHLPTVSARRSRPAAPALALLLLAGSAAAQLVGDFPRVAVPPENPLTPEKARLGQALFFEEQLSADDTMACATCHLFEAGGADARPAALHPGDDGLFGTLDDEQGSAGVRRADSGGSYRAHALFGFEPQATARTAPSVIGAAFFATLFWDARAGGTFSDQAGGVLIPDLAALENVAVQPPVSEIEMGNDGRTWDEVVAKLARVRPLDLAHDVPPRLERFLEGAERYGPLFRRAFGTAEITRERVAMALASYLRTLVADQTPFDLGTLTPRQERGLELFETPFRGQCSFCHPSENGLFASGRRQQNRLPGHPRFVKTPSLRNVGLRRRFMSSGQHGSLAEVLAHYESIGFILLDPPDEEALLDFLANGLTDPRVARGEPPFDRPRLASEVAPSGSRLFGAATPGSGGFRPRMLADIPAVLGGSSFRIGLAEGLGGSPGFLLLGPRRSVPQSFLGLPVWIDTDPARVRLLALDGNGPGQGAATVHLALPADPGLVGRRVSAQWLVLDPGAARGLATSQAAEFELVSRYWRHHARR
jgi:cytochrome c peroxidase